MTIPRPLSRVPVTIPRPLSPCIDSTSSTVTAWTTLFADPQVDQMLALVECAAGCTRDQARGAFKLLFITAHGMASLLANNAMAYDEKECEEMLAGAFAGAMNEEG